jgi:hypothetical protein
LHQIRQKKGVDLTGKKLKKLGGQLTLKVLCSGKPIVVEIGWLCVMI